MGGLVVATVGVEAVIHLPPQRVWDAIADIGAVHRRLLPGRVADARIEDDTRVLTMPDGSQIRELIISVDHSIRRMAYAVTEGQRLPLTYHHAAFQVIGEGRHSRLVWLTDVLPHTMAAAVQARVERGIVEIKQTLEWAEAERQTTHA
jgi:Polyketide cyclase / dehydrase and lipid transport